MAATSAVQPHVSHRRYVYQLPLGLDAPVPANWLLIDVTSKTEMAPGDLKAIVDGLLATDWGVVDGADGFLLLRKGGSEKQIPAAFYDFARSNDSQTQADVARLGTLARDKCDFDCSRFGCSSGLSHCHARRWRGLQQCGSAHPCPGLVAT